MKKIIFFIVLLITSVSQAAEVTLQWNPAAEADGYKIYHGTASRVYNIPMDVGSQTNGTLTLDPGVYYFAVTAYNQYGESGYSEEAGPITINPLPPDDEELPPECPSVDPNVQTVQVVSRVIPDGRTQTITTVKSGNDVISKTYTYSVSE